MNQTCHQFFNIGANSRIAKPPARSLPDLSQTENRRKSNLKKSKRQDPNSRHLTASTKNVSFNPLIAERSRSSSLPKDGNGERLGEDDDGSDSEHYLYFQKENGDFFKIKSSCLQRKIEANRFLRGGFVDEWGCSDGSDSSSSSSSEDEPYYQVYSSSHQRQFSYSQRPASVYGNKLGSSESSPMAQENNEKSFHSKKKFIIPSNKVYKSKCKIS